MVDRQTLREPGMCPSTARRRPYALRTQSGRASYNIEGGCAWSSAPGQSVGYGREWALVGNPGQISSKQCTYASVNHGGNIEE